MRVKGRAISDHSASDRLCRMEFSRTPKKALFVCTTIISRTRMPHNRIDIEVGPMLVTVRDACALQDRALEIHVGDQVEQLDQLIAEAGDGADFFEKTHITGGMETLLREAIARLAGRSSTGIFHLKQAMGGGKTHLLVGLGLTARWPALRKRVCGAYPHSEAFGAAQVAAFNGRNFPTHFFWGEIALQLGRGAFFRRFWESGPRIPGESDWLELFDTDAPVLILLDEMPPHFHALDTQAVGNGTVADIATAAFANLLTAAGKKSNVCVVVSDLTAAYEGGQKRISHALSNARQELGRQERAITPVDLSGAEIYAILRKRLFKALPSKTMVDEIASEYGRLLEEATRAKVAGRGAEAIAAEIAATYPFHPRLKNVIALFRENEQFRQTRGVLELMSRLLKSVWNRPTNDVFLLGPQHFDLGIADVRDALAGIADMREVVARDLWDASASAHAQVADLARSSDATAQVGSLLLTASLSTAVNAIRGLTREAMVRDPRRPESPAFGVHRSA
jgi:hypothetical protein